MLARFYRIREEYYTLLQNMWKQFFFVRLKIKNSTKILNFITKSKKLNNIFRNTPNWEQSTEHERANIVKLNPDFYVQNILPNSKYFNEFN